MKTETASHLEPSAAATIAGEDLAYGDYIALLNETIDFPSFLWDACGASLSPHELVRLKMIPASDRGLARVYKLWSLGSCKSF